MKMMFITPCKDCVLAEIREKASVSLNSIIRQTSWLSWKQMKDVNGKGRLQWYIVVDTSFDKENRLQQFVQIISEEGYSTRSRICPHDLYYEDYERYFEN